MKLNLNSNIFSLNISPVTQTRCITWVNNNQWNGVLTVHADIYTNKLGTEVSVLCNNLGLGLLAMLFDATGELSVIVLSWVLYVCCKHVQYLPKTAYLILNYIPT